MTCNVVTHTYVIEGNTSYTMEELLVILVERHEANKLQRKFTGIIPYILDYWFGNVMFYYKIEFSMLSYLFNLCLYFILRNSNAMQENIYKCIDYICFKYQICKHVYDRFVVDNEY